MHAVRWLLAAAFVCGTAYSVRADADADFYKGRQIKYVISSTTGGGYDIYARTVAKHLPNHVPGKPEVVPQNMPGAGGIKAAEFIFSHAPKDGLTIGALQNTVPFEPMYGNKLAKFDPLKFNWLGSPTKEVAFFFVWHTVPVNSLEDAKHHELILAAAGANSTPAFYSRVLAAIFGLKIKLITGYPGQTEAFLGFVQAALHRREPRASRLVVLPGVAGGPADLAEQPLRLREPAGPDQHVGQLEPEPLGHGPADGVLRGVPEAGAGGGLGGHEVVARRLLLGADVDVAPDGISSGADRDGDLDRLVQQGHPLVDQPRGGQRH